MENTTTTSKLRCIRTTFGILTQTIHSLGVISYTFQTNSDATVYIEKLTPYKASASWCWYAAVFYGQTFYYFGGQHIIHGQGQLMNQIAGLDSISWKWSSLGYLNTARSTHNVILVGNRFMVVGGSEYKAWSQ